jgi:hypothetical protein
MRKQCDKPSKAFPTHSHNTARTQPPHNTPRPAPGRALPAGNDDISGILNHFFSTATMTFLEYSTARPRPQSPGSGFKQALPEGVCCFPMVSDPDLMLKILRLKKEWRSGRLISVCFSLVCLCLCLSVRLSVCLVFVCRSFFLSVCLALSSLSPLTGSLLLQ